MLSSSFPSTCSSRPTSPPSQNYYKLISREVQVIAGSIRCSEQSLVWFSPIRVISPRGLALPLFWNRVLSNVTSLFIKDRT